MLRSTTNPRLPSSFSEDIINAYVELARTQFAPPLPLHLICIQMQCCTKLKAKE
jgi:hypothetical protein